VDGIAQLEEAFAALASASDEDERRYALLH
jgi:hypothetical protein